MHQWIVDAVAEAGLGGYASPAVSVAYLVVGIALGALLWLFIRWPLAGIIAKMNANRKILSVEVLLDKGLFKKAANIAIPAVLYFFLADMAGESVFLKKIADTVGVIAVLMALAVCIAAADAVYGSWEVSKTYPIRGILQVAKIVAFIVAGIIIVSIFAEKNPAVLLGGIGAMTAILTIVFRDAILGFIAGIQLTTSGMIRIGDVIELPKHQTHGKVVDLSLMTVTVENHDKTISSIPAYTLVSDSFLNWRGMTEAGARRIKRCLYIDATGVRVCDDAMIAKFKKIALLKEYVDRRQASIERFNKRLGYDMSEKTNGRRMTNIGVFRAYILAYLKQFPGVRQDMTLVVRQLESGERGIPMEIYAYANTAVLAEYEGIQSDIFDHLYAVISEFGLRLYQNPSSNDIWNMCNPGGRSEAGGALPSPLTKTPGKARPPQSRSRSPRRS